MVDLQTWANVADVVAGSIVLIGIVFAAFQVRQFRQQRRHESAMVLLQSFQTPEFTRGIMAIPFLREGLSIAELKETLGDRYDDVWLLTSTWESLGILVHKRELPLALVEDFFSGGIVLSWRVLRSAIDETRRTMGRDTYWEWFQWLVERIGEHESAEPAIPANVQYKDWKP